MLRLGKVTLTVTPKQLGASAYVGEAVKHARVFGPGNNVPLKVAAPRQRLERYAETLAKRFDRVAVNSELQLRNSKPFVTKEQQGRRLRQSLIVKDLFRSLKTHVRAPILLKQDVIVPQSTRASFGSVIVIRRGLNKLLLYDGMKLRRDFGVATGRVEIPDSASGKWESRQVAQPVVVSARLRLGEGRGADPTGSGQPLGTRSGRGSLPPPSGSDGTPDPASIGYSVSHGCIRMRIPEVEWLFTQVDIGTPV